MPTERKYGGETLTFWVQGLARWRSLFPDGVDPMIMKDRRAMEDMLSHITELELKVEQLKSSAGHWDHLSHQLEVIRNNMGDAKWLAARQEAVERVQRTNTMGTLDILAITMQEADHARNERHNLAAQQRVAALVQ